MVVKCLALIDISHPWIRKLNITEMYILQKLIYKFNMIPGKYLNGISVTSQKCSGLSKQLNILDLARKCLKLK